MLATHPPWYHYMLQTIPRMQQHADWVDHSVLCILEAHDLHGNFYIMPKKAFQRKPFGEGLFKIPQGMHVSR